MFTRQAREIWVPSPWRRNSLMKSFMFTDGTSALILSRFKDLKIVGAVVWNESTNTSGVAQLQLGAAVATEQIPQGQAVGTVPIVNIGPFLSLSVPFNYAIFIPLKETLKAGTAISYNISALCGVTLHCEDS